jgi:hypothetical protein
MVDIVFTVSLSMKSSWGDWRLEGNVCVLSGELWLDHVGWVASPCEGSYWRFSDPGC